MENFKLVTRNTIHSYIHKFKEMVNVIYKNSFSKNNLVFTRLMYPGLHYIKYSFDLISLLYVYENDMMYNYFTKMNIPKHSAACVVL